MAQLWPPTTFIKTINHVQSITSNPSNISDLSLHIILGFAFNFVKPIKTRVLVSQSSADPCLCITHLPPKRFLSQMLQLTQCLAQLIHRVIYLLNTITQCNSLSLFLKTRECVQVVWHFPGTCNAYLDSCLGQVTWGVGRACIRGKSAEAEVRVTSVDAGWTD